LQAHAQRIDGSNADIDVHFRGGTLRAMVPRDTWLKVQNYKCFGEEFQGFEEIRPVNVIVGRNNSGKSTLLDLVACAVSPFDLTASAHQNKTPQVLLAGILSEGDVRKVFKQGSHGGGFPGHVDQWTVGRHCVGKRVSVILPFCKDVKRSLVSIEYSLPDYAKSFEGQLVRVLPNPFSPKVFKRLRAERDIRPESDGDLSLQEDGRGATNAIQRFINKVVLPSDLVECTLLHELNVIMEPDASFTDIVVQQQEDSSWEVFLEEEDKGRIALSESGSGLQTVLLILILLYLVPNVEGRPLEDYVFALEEIENNIHPALQRRLFLYLRSVAIEKKPVFFITTHSNVVIDLFSTDAEAQLIHVIHDGCRATARQVRAYMERRGVLDDLDVRASDLLQSNGVVWVEGPSDRLYFNKWIELASGGELREGAHYQCVFYGGRLLAHLSASVPEDQLCDIMRILLVNKNAIIVMDSDKRTKQARLNKTKIRIRDEMKNIDAFSWITRGREIENYIAGEVVASYCQQDIARTVDPYESFSDYLDEIDSGAGRRFLSNKVLFAENMCRLLQSEHLDGILDLRQRLNEACKRIRSWNGLA